MNDPVRLERTRKCLVISGVSSKKYVSYGHRIMAFIIGNALLKRKDRPSLPNEIIGTIVKYVNPYRPFLKVFPYHHQWYVTGYNNPVGQLLSGKLYFIKDKHAHILYSRPGDTITYKQILRAVSGILLRPPHKFGFYYIDSKIIDEVWNPDEKRCLIHKRIPEHKIEGIPLIMRTWS